MTTLGAIFLGLSYTAILALMLTVGCWLWVMCREIRDYIGRTQILLTLAFLVTWAVIAGLLRWM